MTTSQPLVPTGLPYGSRQQVVEQMQQAGVPLSPPEQGPALESVAVPPPAPASAAATPNTALQVAQFDVLAGRQPTATPAMAAPSVVERFRQAAIESGNPVAVAISQLIDDYLPGT